MILIDEARELLEDELGSDYVIVDEEDTDDSFYQFGVKEKQYENDGFVLPTIYGVDKGTGNILDFNEILNRIHS